MSPYFKLSQGIRQGCPISAQFLLVVEVIATILRKSIRVLSLCVSQTEIKQCQLADDMTLFLSSIESVRTVMNLFEDFYRYSGLKLNKAKTEAFLIKGESIKLCADSTIGIGWS